MTSSRPRSPRRPRSWRRRPEHLPGEPWDATTATAWTKALGAVTARRGKALFHPLRLGVSLRGGERPGAPGPAAADRPRQDGAAADRDVAGSAGQRLVVRFLAGPRVEKIILALLLMVFVVPTGLFLAVFVPPGQIPDEPAHVARIESLLHGEITGHRRPGLDAAGHRITLSGVVINEAPFTVSHLFGDLAPGRKMSAAVQQRLDSVPWASHTSFVFAPNTAVYFPVFYLPAAVGMGLGRLHGLTPYGAIVAARVANLLAYVVVSAFALALARRGWRLMFAALSLPMTIWLAASCNEDGLLIASTCLAAALLTRAAAPRGAAYWAAAALLACVIAVKPAYLPAGRIHAVALRRAGQARLGERRRRHGRRIGARRHLGARHLALCVGSADLGAALSSRAAMAGRP